MELINPKDSLQFDFETEEEIFAQKYALNEAPAHTTMLCLNSAYDKNQKNFLPHGEQTYAVKDQMTFEELRNIWWQCNFKKFDDHKVEQYVLTYQNVFPLELQETVGDLKKKLQKQAFGVEDIIGVFQEWDCPISENQSAGFSYEEYEEKNISQIQTTFKFRSTAPHNSCYFYVKSMLKTTISQLKQSIQKYLSSPDQKYVIRSKSPLEQQSFLLLIKKDAIKTSKLQEIYVQLKQNAIYFDPNSHELDFTNLDHLKIRDICPPGQTIYIQFEDEEALEVRKPHQKQAQNKKIRIVCYENIDKNKIGAPTTQQQIIEKKVIERYFQEIKNIKVHTLLHEERIKNALTTSINCAEMTIKPDQTFEKFSNIIVNSNQQVLNLYTYPENFFYYKTIRELESISMQKIIDTLKVKTNLKEEGRTKCEMKREQYRQRVDPAFRNEDFLDPIVLYTSPYVYPSFNKNLRENSISLVEKQTIFDSMENLWHYPFSEKLIKSLNKLPNYQGKVFRISTKTNYNYQDGEVVEWNSFSSTAKSQEVALSFLQGSLKNADKSQISPNLTYFFQIDSYSGKSIEEFSFYPKQKEVLLLPYTKLKVLSQKIVTLPKQNYEVTWVHLKEIPIPKKIPGNVVVWIDANINENLKAFNKIVEVNKYKNCDLIQLVSNEHFELWLQEFKETLSLPGVKVQFITNMNRPPLFQQEGVKTLEMIRSFNKEAKVIYYIGNVAKTKKILTDYWQREKIAEDKNIEIVQKLGELNTVFQKIIGKEEN